jgi:predicted nucleic acid-binding protein
MADVALDANVVVGFLDASDTLHERAAALLRRIETRGDDVILLDVCVGEAISVLCRRARERRGGTSAAGLAKAPPDLRRALERVRQWILDGDIVWLSSHTERFATDVLDVVESTRGRLNWNDALLVVLQREGIVAEVASFDDGFEAIPTFRRIS